jgi:hypothetical protein
MTPEHLAMCRRLFPAKTGRPRLLSQYDMWQILHRLRSAPELEPFHLYLVGSRVEAGHETADIDVILSPRPGSAFSDLRIERALWFCRAAGMQDADPVCWIDPAFRREGPSVRMVPLLPEAMLQTSRLLSPGIAALLRKGCITRYRRFGRFCIEYWRPAGETSFYKKLPAFSSVEQGRYLRPAIAVTSRLR